MFNNSIVRRLLLLVLVSIFISFNSVSAGRKWVSYTDFKNVSCLSMDRNSQVIYCGTTGGLFITDLNTGSVLKKYTNIEGLLNNNITALITDNQNKLWVGASDGSICVLDNVNSTFKYILDIKNSTETNKNIYSFALYGNYIYVATGFGIIKISTSTLNFVDAPYYQLGNFTLKSKVNDLTIMNDVIYAATVSGMAYANLINSNLNNPASWTNYNASPLYSNVISTKAFNGKVFAGGNNGFMFYDGINWNLYPNSNYSESSIKCIAPVGDRLFFIANNGVFSAFKDSLDIVLPYNTNDNCNTIISDNNKKPVVGISEKGIYISLNNTTTYITPNCPNRNSFNHISEDSDGNLWAASGLPDGGFYMYNGSTWTNYTKEQYPQIGNSNYCWRIYSKYNQTWALFWGSGATLVSGQYINNFNRSNSILPGIPEDSNFCVPHGGAFDNNNFFWLIFYGAYNSKLLHVYTGNSNFVGYINPPIQNFPIRLISVAIDNYGTKWIVGKTSNDAGCVYFFNENGTISNTSDDIYGLYTKDDFSEINSITDVIVDRSNYVWVTTNNGVFILDNPLGAIQDPNNKPPFSKLGIIYGNLKVPFTENCRTLCSDVLNEKWIGTESNGVFHLSEDGSTLIEQFNISNSPILSNTIYSILVSGKNGKAYFATLNGLSSVETNAIQPVESFDKIICKPNPYIIPSSKNPTLTIDGLIENSTIKIITLNGEVVAEYTARTGRIDDQWNGTDKKGNLVPTGIYIVVAYNKDGSKVGKGKIAVIRK